MKLSDIPAKRIGSLSLGSWLKLCFAIVVAGVIRSYFWPEKTNGDYLREVIDTGYTKKMVIAYVASIKNANTAPTPTDAQWVQIEKGLSECVDEQAKNFLTSGDRYLSLKADKSTPLFLARRFLGACGATESDASVGSDFDAKGGDAQRMQPLGNQPQANPPAQFPPSADDLKKLAEQGDVSAQSKLGQMYTDGVGVWRDYKQAAFWFQKAAAQGNVKAQISLGSFYEEGKGVAKDYNQAEFWYKQAVVNLQKAVAQGDTSAQFELGFMYEEGKGVAKDYKQAAFWYEKSAAQGNAIAMFSLNSLYSDGAAKDNVEAYKWATIAAARGIPALAEMRKVLETEMTKEQIAEAQRRATEWMKAHK